ncbi:MAG: hypothetical protein ACYDB7_06195, partial [Mycobacteriales bacterium]
RDPDALIYQYVVLAIPARAPGEDLHDRPPLVERLAELLTGATAARTEAEGRASQLAAQLARYTGTDPLAPDGLPAPETVQALLSARDDLHRSQTQLMLVEQQLENRSEVLRRTEGERLALQGRLTDLRAQSQAAEAARAQVQAELDAIHASRLWALAQAYRRVRALAAARRRAP